MEARYSFNRPSNVSLFQLSTRTSVSVSSLASPICCSAKLAATVADFVASTTSVPSPRRKVKPPRNVLPAPVASTTDLGNFPGNEKAGSHRKTPLSCKEATRQPRLPERTTIEPVPLRPIPACKKTLAYSSISLRSKRASSASASDMGP